MMNRRFLVIFILFILCGCQSESYNNYIEEGNKFLALEDYDSAKNMFILANNEKNSKSKKAQGLIQQIDLYQEINKMLEWNDLMTSTNIQAVLDKCEELMEIDQLTLLYEKSKQLHDEYSNVLNEVIKQETWIDNHIRNIYEYEENGDFENGKVYADDIYNKISRGKYNGELTIYIANYQKQLKNISETLTSKIEMEWDPAWSTKADGYSD